MYSSSFERETVDATVSSPRLAWRNDTPDGPLLSAQPLHWLLDMLTTNRGHADASAIQSSHIVAFLLSMEASSRRTEAPKASLA